MHGAMRARLAVALLLFACGDAPDGDLSGGVLATFAVGDETFRVFVTNPATIQQILDLRDGASEASIPSGALRTGRGRADHNLPWSWHLDPEDIEMAEVTTEVCDGTPSLVEADLPGYLAVGRFCPWTATLESVEDLR